MNNRIENMSRIPERIETKTSTQPREHTIFCQQLNREYETVLENDFFDDPRAMEGHYAMRAAANGNSWRPTIESRYAHESAGNVKKSVVRDAINGGRKHF